VDWKETVMHEVYTYQIEVQGRVAANDLNALSPLQMTVLRAEAAATRLAIHTDQAGLIGLLRHLHGSGFVILSMSRSR
jgi:hypothetical protein